MRSNDTIQSLNRMSHTQCDANADGDAHFGETVRARTLKLHHANVPPDDLPKPQEALRELLHVEHSSYVEGVRHAGSIATFGAGEVSLPCDAGDCPSAELLLEDHVRQVYKGFREQMLRSPSEYAEFINAHGLQNLQLGPVLKRSRRK